MKISAELCCRVSGMHTTAPVELSSLVAHAYNNNNYQLMIRKLIAVSDSDVTEIVLKVVRALWCDAATITQQDVLRSDTFVPICKRITGNNNTRIIKLWCKTKTPNPQLQ